MNARPAPVDNRRGAPMGRSTYDVPRGTGTFDESSDPARCRLSYLPLNSGGYDAGGTYWGHGERIYWLRDAATNGGDLQGFVRAPNRAAAWRELHRMFPRAIVRGTAL